MYPKLLSFPKPPYPAAARAVRATGEVVVLVKIDKG
jgi:outer membrane biosynthesis protein TonB